MIKPRLLFISSRPLFPIIGGDQIRTVQQLEFLLEKFDVDVILISPDKEGIDNNKEIPGVRNVFCYEIGKVRSMAQAFRFVCNSLPIQVNYYYNAYIVKTLTFLPQSEKYSKVF